METSLRCPTCSKPLPVGTPHGLCPECLLRAGLATGTQPAAGKAAPFVPPTPAELAPLFPQLEILELIGRGGMGAVYRARQPKLDRFVALKILPPQAGRDAGFAERFTREARALGRLSHPNIVAVHEFGAAGEYHFLVMELVDGVTLRQLLATAKPTPREALAIVPQICDALQFAHDRGIVHRDIKPENILIDRRGAVKIADFGLAKIVGGTAPDLSITGAHEVMGTPHYMAPEQVEQPLAVDHRADIYSVGVVFYQMLTGELPLGRFAPPSRKVQIDVRLDEVVLRALEKEPELRYQRASGLKTEVETIATSAGGNAGAVAADGPDENDAVAARTRALALPHETKRSRWLVLAAAWLVAGALLGFQARLVNQYLDTVGGLGRSELAATPLQQMFPAFAADAQMWVRHALSLLEGDSLRLRHTDIDNAPHGREVHWSSAWAWCIAGAGKAHQLCTGLPLPQAVERATLWLNPLAMLACIVGFSAWAARRLGAIAGVLVVIAMLGHDRIYEGFFPSYVDHHGLATVAVFGLVLGAVMMRGGWRQRAGGFSALPSSAAALRNGSVFSALSGACGLWVSAASTLPTIAIVGCAALLAVVLQGRSAAEQGAVFDGGAWRLWGRLGAGVSFGFYLLEYFPGHLSFRLEVNHPLHALAWLGGGEMIAQLGERWLAPREQRWKQPATLLWPVLAVAVLMTIGAGSRQLFAVFDPFVATLHRDYIQEFLPMRRALEGFRGWALYQLIVVGLVPIAAAGVTLALPRKRDAIVIGFAALVTAALAGMAWMQARWLLNVSGASIALLVVLLAAWTVGLRPWVRAAIVGGVAAVCFLPAVILRYEGAAAGVASRTVSPRDAGLALSRDIAAALRAAQPRGEVVLVGSPNASVSVSYYGRFKTLGTLYWENGEGLKAAAKILAANTEAEAAALIRERGVTHVVLVSEENFIAQFFRLLHPKATDEQVRNCFGVRLLRGEAPPPWLRAIPYRVPKDLEALRTTVQLFEVRLGAGAES